MNKKSLIQLPLVRLLDTRLSTHYSARERARTAILQRNMFSCASQNAIWLYTLMKSGTTYTLLFLSNYISFVFGDRSSVDFDRMNGEFFWHSFESAMCREEFEQLCANGMFARGLIPGYRGLIHTHVDTESNEWSKAICLYRNPLDYIISSYYYFHVNRGIRLNHPRDIIDQKVESFVAVYGRQLELVSTRPNDVLQVSYERLMSDPNGSFGKMIQFLGWVVDEEGVAFAMEHSSRKKVKEMESSCGRAIVQGSGGRFEGSFVRSGKVGEWKEYFNDADLQRVESILNKSGLSLNEFEAE